MPVRRSHSLRRPHSLLSSMPVQPPAPWAPTALRLALGLAGTLLTTIALWSLSPPPI